MLAVGLDWLANIGRDPALVIAGAVAFVGALVGWIVSSRRAAAAERRLDDIDCRMEGPTARELCGELSRIITPYRDSRIGRPIHDNLSPERQFLRNLRLQLRLSRQRRQRIEAMHAENLAECARLRDELEAIRRAADEAASAVSKVTLVPPAIAPAPLEALPPADPPPADMDAAIADSSVPPTAEVPVNDADAANDEPASAEHAGSLAPADTDAMDDEMTDLVFSALDEIPLEEIEPLSRDLEALDQVEISPVSEINADDEAIDFDLLLAESAARQGVDLPENDESLGGVEAFNQGLANAVSETQSNADDITGGDVVEIASTGETGPAPTPTVEESDEPVADEAIDDLPVTSTEDESADSFVEPDALAVADNNVAANKATDDVDAVTPEAAESGATESDSKKKSTPDDLSEPSTRVAIIADVPGVEANLDELSGCLAGEVDSESPISAAAGMHDSAADVSEIERARNEISEAIQRADNSRQALESLDASLNANLAHRREILERIDSALCERQIQLVTDILRAEAEHLSLTDALNQIRTSVDAVQADIARVVNTPAHGADPHDSDNPGRA